MFLRQCRALHGKQANLDSIEFGIPVVLEDRFSPALLSIWWMIPEGRDRKCLRGPIIINIQRNCRQQRLCCSCTVGCHSAAHRLLQIRYEVRQRWQQGMVLQCCRRRSILEQSWGFCKRLLITRSKSLSFNANGTVGIPWEKSISVLLDQKHCPINCIVSYHLSLRQLVFNCHSGQEIKFEHT